MFDLGRVLFESGDYERAYSVYRNCLLFEKKALFSNVKALFYAAETAFLQGDFLWAEKLYGHIVRFHGSGEYLRLSKMRVHDIRVSVKNQENKMSVSDRDVYSALFFENPSFSLPSVLCLLRVLHCDPHFFVKQSKSYRVILEKCVAGKIVPFALERKCAYHLLRSLIDVGDFISAQEFLGKNFMEGGVYHDLKDLESLEGFLKDSASMCVRNSFRHSKSSVLEIHDNLDSKYKDVEDFAYARSVVWHLLNKGRADEAHKIALDAWHRIEEEKKQDEFSSENAFLFYKSGYVKRGKAWSSLLHKFHKKCVSDEIYKNVSDFVLSFQDRNMLNCLLEDFRNQCPRPLSLSVFRAVEYQAHQMGLDAMPVYAKIYELVLKEKLNVKDLESSLYRYARKLQKIGNNTLSGDVFSTLSKIEMSPRRTKYLFLSGTLYARAGLIEKAKKSFQSAVLEIQDRRYADFGQTKTCRFRHIRCGGRLNMSDSRPTGLFEDFLSGYSDSGRFEQHRGYCISEEEILKYFPTRNEKIYKILEMVRAIAPTRVPVLITGESGTGKEMLAKTIHIASGKERGRFIVANCANLPNNFFEMELFRSSRSQDFPASQDITFDICTLMLDEITDMDPNMQVKLLKVLKDQESNKGSQRKCFSSDARMIVCTHKNIHDEVNAQRFRQDLFFKINVVLLEIPPLRTRPVDIDLYADMFVKEFNSQFSKSVQLSLTARQALRTYTWPGNVRELKNVIQRSVVLCNKDFISIEDLHLMRSNTRTEIAMADPLPQITLRELEQRLILQTLRRLSGNRTRTARALGISLRALRYKLNELVECGYEVEGKNV